jgi:hypothetical protein
LLITEQALADNAIPFTVLGGADVGLRSVPTVRVCVPEQYRHEALSIVKQIVD